MGKKTDYINTENSDVGGKNCGVQAVVVLRGGARSAAPLSRAVCTDRNLHLQVHVQKTPTHT